MMLFIERLPGCSVFLLCLPAPTTLLLLLRFLQQQTRSTVENGDKNQPNKNPYHHPRPKRNTRSDIFRAFSPSLDLHGPGKGELLPYSLGLRDWHFQILFLQFDHRGLHLESHGLSAGVTVQNHLAIVSAQSRSMGFDRSQLSFLRNSPGTPMSEPVHFNTICIFLFLRHKFNAIKSSTSSEHKNTPPNCIFSLWNCIYSIYSILYMYVILNNICNI